MPSRFAAGHDLTNDTVMDAVWPIITNREALAINDAWVGDAGTLVKKSDEMVTFINCGWGFNRYCLHSLSVRPQCPLKAHQAHVLVFTTSASASLPYPAPYRCKLYHTDTSLYPQLCPATVASPLPC